ncbi:MAG: hypothetical protein EZS28_000268 [Streblomastix strix]|uniref:Uncharacterized protein n=1 Tax=Streblomastix strix TaxID=222440 RepID=A0A5J4XBL9_9EUKA|nr:MAG: hypothetical protein EZS28_000268 [Streblomastix strix]
MLNIEYGDISDEDHNSTEEEDDDDIQPEDMNHILELLKERQERAKINLKPVYEGASNLSLCIRTLIKQKMKSGSTSFDIGQYAVIAGFANTVSINLKNTHSRVSVQWPTKECDQIPLALAIISIGANYNSVLKLLDSCRSLEGVVESFGEENFNNLRDSNKKLEEFVVKEEAQ